jgi:hypothetical protein
VRTWRGTANGIEGTAVLFSDTLLPLDELGVASALEVGNIVYSLASGIGKQRAQQDGSLRRSKTWRVIVLSTGELSIADKIREAGKSVRAGQEIRILDIDADAGKGFGVFDHGGPDGDAGKLAIAIKEATVKFYGTAGPAFVKALSAEGLDKIAADIKVAQAALTERLTGGAANGQVSRAAQRFALIGVAGELAIQLGILPLSPGQVATAAEELFATWRGNRGDDPGEITAAIEQIRTLLERFGDSRFDSLTRGPDTRPVSDRLGWVRGTGGERQWLIPPGVWRDVFCQGFDARIVARVLADRGMLLLDAQPDLGARLLAAVKNKELEQDGGNAKLGCDGVTSFNPLTNSGVTSSSNVTPELLRQISAVTPSHLLSSSQEGQELPADAKGSGLEQPYGRVHAALRDRCPDLVEQNRWQEAVADAAAFVAQWGEQAAAFGWTGRDLFGLADVPDRPASNYQRLSRYDLTGLVWLLQGRRVVTLTKDTAVIETATGTVSYRRHNKPALGPLGDSLDDMGQDT